MRRLGRHSDALAPAPRPSTGADLADPVLAAVFRDVELGTWTIGSDSIAVLQDMVVTADPRVVLEFGSGVSTVCLAHFGAARNPPTVIVSIEQDATEVERTKSLVARLPDAAPVVVLHAPLELQVIEGRALSGYSISEAELDKALDGRLIDLVVIDGPAAEDGARFGTLPLVQSRLSPGALVLMDDALRDGELAAARGWVELGLVKVQGVIPVEHGMLLGHT